MKLGGCVPMQDKTCRICHDRFTPTRTFQKNCSEGCDAIQKVRDREKVKKKENTKEKKEFQQSDRKFLLELSQKTCNTYIRMRDGKSCISCGKTDPNKVYHAGHFKAQGGNSALRFDELNIHVQCYRCNVELSSNQSAYREALIKKIGIEAVIYLETTKNTKLWTVDELKEIIVEYKAKIKQLTL